jgi:hypothetical protein
MGDWTKIIESLGSSGLLIFVVWRLLDKWAARFLDAQKLQADAMGALALAVKETAGAAVTAAEAQRELLMAVRVLSAKQDETKEWLKELLSTQRMGA